MIRDLRLAVRSWLRTPGVALVALLSLALGIGANTIAFSLVNALQLRPLPFPDPHDLVDVHETSATELCADCGVGTSWPGYVEWKASARSFTGMGAYADADFAIAAEGGEPRRVGGSRVTPEFFPVLGARAVRGRLVEAADAEPGAPPVIVLSHEIWSARFGADTALVGGIIRVNGVAHTVIGVLPPHFGIPEFASAWVPLVPPADWARSDRSLGVVARLAPGVGLERSRAEMASIAAAQAQSFPESNRNWSASATSLHADMASETLPFSYLLMAAVAFVLLIACANVAGLMLVRATTRRRELAVRLALGAGRRRIVQLLLAESLVISLLGGGLGLLFTVWGSRFAVRAIGTAVPAWIVFGVDLKVLLFCLAASVATGIGFGILPALEASRPDVQRELKEGVGASSGRRGSLLRNGFVVAQLALALVLLVGAGLMMKTLVRIRAQDHGYPLAGLVRADVDLLSARYQRPGEVAAFADALTARLRQVPGLRAAVSRFHFIAGFGGRDRGISVEGRAIAAGASPRFATVISDGYFATLGLGLGQGLVSGRDFTTDESRRGGEVAIVSAAMAERIWPGESPLGRRIRLGPADSAYLPWLTVIGIAADAGRPGRDGQHASMVYVPLGTLPQPSLTLHLRTALPLETVAPLVRNVVREIDADQPVENLMTEAQSIARWAAPARSMALIMGSLAGVALLLATIGIYGVTAFSVASRTREIGIRMALGASGAAILAMILRGATRLAIIALVLGSLGAIAFAQLLRAVLFGTSPTDPLVFVVVTAVLFSVTLLASLIPARRAAAIDPTVAVRYD